MRSPEPGARPGRPQTPQAPYLFFLNVFPRLCHPRRREDSLSLWRLLQAPPLPRGRPARRRGPVLLVLAPAAQKGRSRAPSLALAVRRRLPSLAARCDERCRLRAVLGPSGRGRDVAGPPGTQRAAGSPACAPLRALPAIRAPAPALPGPLHVGTSLAGSVLTLTGHSWGRIP